MASAPDSKLSAQVAAQIEDSIHVNAWPANHCLGAEEHLSARFGASRAVIREAIAIAEWNGSVERRRGREGGVFVTPFSPNAAVGMLRNFLFLAGADLAGLLRARRLVEGAILDLAMQRMAGVDYDRLAAILPRKGEAADDRASLERLKSIVEHLADVAGSAGLKLFGSALRHCFVDRVRTTTSDDRAYLAASGTESALRLQQIEAILAADRLAAIDLQGRAMGVWSDFVADLPVEGLASTKIVERLSDPGHDALIYEFVRPLKKPEALARAIAQTISSRQLATGSRLGTEQALVSEFSVSRRVLREGVRILQHFGVVEAERGMRGGLVVAAPSRDSLTGLLGRVSAVTGEDRAALWLLPEMLRDAASGIAAAQPEVRADFVAKASAVHDSSATVAHLLGDRTPAVAAGCIATMLLPLLAAPGPDRPEHDWAPVVEAIAAGDALLAARLARTTMAVTVAAGAVP